jgi:ABC-type lipoprotein export system ATPase subunit/ABC-type lipoprotein release transport system permease subunit
LPNHSNKNNSIPHFEIGDWRLEIDTRNFKSLTSNLFFIMQNTIQITNLNRRFERGEDDVWALRGIDLTIAPGEFVALVGPSGSGKSTLLNLLGGLDHPSDGELWIDGLPLHSADAKERTAHRRYRVGFIFQSFNLLPRLTAVENVAIPLSLTGVEQAERQVRTQAILEKVGLGHRLDHYPTELSGGEQQRTAVARALIHNPSLILADEPTGNLDSKTGEEVMALLQRLNKEEGITLIVVTHDAEVAAFADRVVHLRDGQIETITHNQPSTESSEQTTVNDQSSSPNHPTSFPSSRLPFSDILRSSVKNLRRRPVRNILTAGGVLIGIITLVAMVSFGVGVQQEVQRNFETIGLENIFVSPTFEGQEEENFDPFAEPEPRQALTPDIVDKIEQLPLVTAVTPELRLPWGIEIALSYGDQELPVFASSDMGARRFGFGGTNEAVAGEIFTEGETEGLVLVSGLADRLVTDGQTYDDLVGETVNLTITLPRGESADFPATIVGIRDSIGSRTIDIGLAETEAIKAWWFGQPDIVAQDGYDTVIVRAENLGAVTAVTEAIQELEMDAQSLEAILDTANQVLALLQALLGSVGALALLVAALGVANTMMMAIYERTREIGVLKALGASPGEIRALFTTEAAMIGLIGGVFGLFFGMLLGRLVDWIAHRYLINEGVTGVGQLSVVPPWLAIGAVLFAALIGLLAGLYPAARAARLDPVQALRHE